MKRCSVSFTERNLYKNKPLFFLNKSMLLKDADISGGEYKFFRL